MSVESLENNLGENIPYFTLTINLDKGISDKLEIHSLNDYEQETYDFCMKNKLKYAAMININRQIKSLIKTKKYNIINQKRNKGVYTQSLEWENITPNNNRKIKSSLKKNNKAIVIPDKKQVVNSKKNISSKIILNNKKIKIKKIGEENNSNYLKKYIHIKSIKNLNCNSGKNANFKKIISQKNTIFDIKNNKRKLKRNLVLKQGMIVPTVDTKKASSKTIKNINKKKSENIKLSDNTNILYKKKLVLNKFKTEKYLTSNTQNVEHNKKNKNEKNDNLFLQNYNINPIDKYQLNNTSNISKINHNFITIQNISNIHNESYNKNLSSDNNSFLDTNKKKNTFKKIFKLLDNDNDNLISPAHINVNNLPINFKKLLMPLLNELENENETLTESEFIYICEKYFNNLNNADKTKIFNEKSNKELFHKKIYEEFYKPKFNNYFDYLSKKTENENHINNSNSLFNSLIETHSSDSNYYYFMKSNDNIPTGKNSLKNNKNEKKQTKKLCRSNEDKRNNNCSEIYYNSLYSNHKNMSLIPYFIYNLSTFRGNPNINCTKSSGVSACPGILAKKYNSLSTSNDFGTVSDGEVMFGFDFSNISRTSNTNYMPISYLVS